MKKPFAVILLFALVAVLELFSSHEWHDHRVAIYDPAGYYLYLPATFIYHDPGQFAFYPAIDQQYRLADLEWAGLYEQPLTGRRMDKYPIGVAIGELPLFFVAHAVCLAGRQYPAEGFSEPYQFCISMSTLIWCLLGLWFTARVLREFFSETVVAVTVFLLAFATNIYTYSCTSTGMSHLLVFFQFALFLWCFVKWRAGAGSGYLYGQALLLGWVLITRPVDVVIFLVPLIWTLQERGIRPFLHRRGRPLAVAFLCFSMIVSLQLLYWKWSTGHLVYFSYEHEGFHFTHPHIVDGLFSFYRGWFVYTPLALIAMAGFLFLPPALSQARLAVLCYLCVIIYLVFSWYYWSYGWGFGCRALIESLAVVSVLLAALVSRIIKARKAMRMAGAVVAVLLAVLNFVQTHQYAGNVLPDGITRAYYQRVFLKMSATEEDRRLLEPRTFKYP